MAQVQCVEQTKKRMEDWRRNWKTGQQKQSQGSLSQASGKPAQRLSGSSPTLVKNGQAWYSPQCSVIGQELFRVILRAFKELQGTGSYLLKGTFRMHLSDYSKLFPVMTSSKYRPKNTIFVLLELSTISKIQ